jgi:hypothetical protein
VRLRFFYFFSSVSREFLSMAKRKAVIVDSALDVKEIEGAIASEEELSAQDPSNADEIIEKNKGQKNKKGKQ